MGDPKFIDTPKGDQLVILTRDDYEALVAAGEALETIEDSADVATAEARRADWEAAGRPAYPLAVVRLIRAGSTPLRAFRQHRNLTQGDLAAKVGIEPSDYSDIEASKKVPSPETLEAIAAALGVSAASLRPPGSPV